jgi:hypothetical protein
LATEEISVARWRFSPPDLEILADLKVVWWAKNISSRLPISGGFLADLTNFAWVCFCLAVLADSGGFGVFFIKNLLFSHFF